MRQVWIEVPRGSGAEVVGVAGRFEATAVARVEAQGPDGSRDLVLAHVSNGRVEGLIDALQERMPEVRIAFQPTGVVALHPPRDQAAAQVKDVQIRSPIEVFLGAMQSVGSWTGLLGYAAAGGVIAWIGLFTNSQFLLVAAMLIAPFAGPAMTLAIATARGDLNLLGRSLARYAASLGLAIAVAWGLSMLLGQQVATAAMVENSQVSTVAVLLPLVAGAAGALNLLQSSRNSLVSGAAVGMLIAASLAPPAGLIGMASAIGRWDMVQSGLFLLPLQLVAINLAGAAVFRFYGLKARGVRYSRGRKGLVPVAFGASALVLAGLITWQFWTSPNLRRSSLAQRAAAEVQRVVDRSDLASLVEANVRFTRASIPGQDTLLVVVYAQRKDDVQLPAESIRASLTRSIQERLRSAGFNLVPLVDVNVLDPPSGGPATAQR